MSEVAENNLERLKVKLEKILLDESDEERRGREYAELRILCDEVWPDRIWSLRP